MNQRLNKNKSSLYLQPIILKLTTTKKILLTVTTCGSAFSGAIIAQTPYVIPNAGFENWQASGKADNWSGYGDIGLLYGVSAYTMATTHFQESTIKNSGSFSIKIK